jgi:predicted SAM-dependent methyltransferase
LSRKLDLNHIIATVVIAVATVTLVSIWVADYGESHLISAPTDSAAAPAAATAAMADFKQRSPATIDAYLRQQGAKKLQIGAGTARHEGWLNTDIEPGDGLAFLDASKPFPLPDAAFDYVASEHVIEHLSFAEGTNMIAESYRVLAPGGRVRVATPNLLRFIELFEQNRSEAATTFMAGKLAWHEWPKEPSSPAIVLNLQLSSWGHRFTYDPPTLTAALTRAGFTAIQQFEMSESDDPVLHGFEARTTGVNAATVRHETMVIQATKPSQATRAH